MLLILSTLTLAQGTFAPLNHIQLPPSKSEFSFIAMGDNRPVGPGLPATDTFRKIIAEAAIIAPDFIISTGDLVYGKEESTDLYKAEMADIDNVLSVLPCPFFNAAGNHEMSERQELADLYTGHWGATHGLFNFGGVRFVAVSTDEIGHTAKIEGDQFAWLQGLAANPVPTFVYQHRPVIQRPTNTDKPEDAIVFNADGLHQLYKQMGALGVFEGHDHVYYATEKDGLPYIIAGGAGAPLDALPKDGGFFHYVLVHYKDGKFDQSILPAGSLEVHPMGDGVVFAGDYSGYDLPLNHLQVKSTFKPTSVTATAMKKKGPAPVEAKIVSITGSDGAYVTTVSLTLVKHREVQVIVK